MRRIPDNAVLQIQEAWRLPIPAELTSRRDGEDKEKEEEGKKKPEEEKMETEESGASSAKIERYNPQCLQY